MPEIEKLEYLANSLKKKFYSFKNCLKIHKNFHKEQHPINSLSAI